jgi:ketosteroid isomerase-like protein
VTVADELEIRNLLARLAQLADTEDVPRYLALLAEDVIWEMPANPTIGLAASTRRGRGEIEAGIRERTADGLQGPGSDTMHVITTTTVDVDDDTATALSSFLFYGTTSDAPVLRSMGRYHDTLLRTGDGWKLARRTISFG